jgi:Protein of unknown function (DUF2796)
MLNRSIQPAAGRAAGRSGAAIFAVVFSVLAPHAAAQHGAHMHGAVRLDVAIDARSLVIEMTAPLDSLLGFERPPRTVAEKQAAQALLSRLKQGHNLLMPDAAADCRFQSATAESAALAPGARAGEHADLDARFEWTCGNAAAARSVDLGGLIEAFPRIRTIELQIASPAGQFKHRLQPPQTRVRWGR